MAGGGVIMRVTLLLSALISAPAHADDTATVNTIGMGEELDLVLDGHTRWIGASHPDFIVDSQANEQGEGTLVGQGFALDHRLRFGAQLVAKEWKLELQGDLFTGQLAGDTWDLGPWDERRRDAHTALDTSGFVPRNAYLEGMVGNVQLTAGLVTSDWGLGLLANDGERQPLFGRADLGDRNLRLGLFTAPFKGEGGPQGHLPLYVGFAADAVVADDTSRWQDGQGAYNLIGALLWRPSDGKLNAGTYVVYRYQRERESSRNTSVLVPDAYVDTVLPIGDWNLRLAGEGAVTLGQTSRALSYNKRDHLALAAGGAALVGELHAPEDALILHLRSGVASGDRNQDDERSTSFAFDRNYNVGSVLFDEYMAGIESGTSKILHDPQYAGQPPDGIEGLTTEGAFKRAVYVQPAVEGWATKWLNLRAGLVMAWATSPHNQPFYTVRAGGDPRTHLDTAPTGRGIGTEIDWAIRIDPNQVARLKPRGTSRERTTDMRVVHAKRPLQPWFLIQGGHAFISKDLATTGDRQLMLISGQAQLDW
ncbi:MAG: hypothetical protein ACI9MC_000081 [Kiritimatiellia bacterium]|jgi:hypothetical protein